ncbi:translation initiation factor IF-2 [Candidatus Woesearchaeota archaeon]|nr:translation initiation factor IF-2 [Candidatus Woesearchaeota archaeon]
MATRKVLVTIVGHVDHGKTSLLDKIRHSAVAAGEAGAITQAIGVSIIPIDIIQKICGKLLDLSGKKLTVPGLLTIDTPGHAAFVSLRKRGGSLADIAILVVDINEGFRPQTLESIEILRAHKVPFVIAANKVDLVPNWKWNQRDFLLDAINNLDYSIQGEFEKRMYNLVGQFQEITLQAERFDRVQDYTKQLAIVPVSAFTGQGIPELLMVLMGLAQKYLEARLQIEVKGKAKGTILEVTEEKGLGTTMNTIIYDGHLLVNDTIVIGGLDQPIVTKVRALLEPAELAEMRDKKSAFRNVKEVFAATGVKIVAPGIEKAIAGMPLRAVENKPEEIDRLKEEIQRDIGEVLILESDAVGVVLKADTLGGLEALKVILGEKQIPIASASLGTVTKRDISQVESLRDKDEFYGVLLGFNIIVPAEIIEYCTAKNIKLIVHNVIYQVIEEYERYTTELKKMIELRELSTLVRPCKFLLLKGYVFRQNNPAIVGVEIEIGRLRSGDPLMDQQGRRLTVVKSMKEGQETITIAEQGKQLALAMDNVTIGRQVQEGDFLYTDIPEEHFKKLKALKRHLTKIEVAVLKEVAEIKRKENPVWGVG